MSERAFVQPGEASIEAAIEEVAAEREMLDDANDWLAHVMDLGVRMKRAHPFVEAWKNEEFFVPGCASNLWIVPRHEDGLLHFAASADAIMTAGNVALLLRVYSGRRPADIIAHPPQWMQTRGLVNSMTVNRVNGVAAAAQRIQQIAAACGPG